MVELKSSEGVPTMNTCPPRLTMKERQRQLREDAILDAALELLATKGYDAMTLEDITELIGISRPTLYQHFRSKEDIVMHICLRSRIQLWEYINNQDRSRSAHDRLIDFCDYALEMRFGAQGMAFGDMMKVISAQQDVNSEMTECEAKLIDAYNALGEEAQAEGSVRQDMSPILMSQVIVGLIKNYALDALIAEGKVTIAEIKDAAKRLLMPPA